MQKKSRLKAAASGRPRYDAKVSLSKKKLFIVSKSVLEPTPRSAKERKKKMVESKSMK
jgi:hypothetical protein